MDPHQKDIMGFVPSTVKPLYVSFLIKTMVRWVARVCSGWLHAWWSFFSLFGELWVSKKSSQRNVKEGSRHSFDALLFSALTPRDRTSVVVLFVNTGWKLISVFLPIGRTWMT